MCVSMHALSLYKSCLMFMKYSISLGISNGHRTYIINHFINTNKIRCALAIQEKYEPINLNLLISEIPKTFSFHSSLPHRRVCQRVSKILHRKCCSNVPVTLRSQKNIFFKGTFASSLSDLTFRRSVSLIQSPAALGSVTSARGKESLLPAGRFAGRTHSCSFCLR